jgi:hypothetical protein
LATQLQFPHLIEKCCAQLALPEVSNLWTYANLQWLPEYPERCHKILDSFEKAQLEIKQTDVDVWGSNDLKHRKWQIWQKNCQQMADYCDDVTIRDRLFLDASEFSFSGNSAAAEFDAKLRKKTFGLFPECLKNVGDENKTKIPETSKTLTQSPHQKEDETLPPMEDDFIEAPIKFRKQLEEMKEDKETALVSIRPYIEQPEEQDEERKTRIWFQDVYLSGGLIVDIVHDLPGPCHDVDLWILNNNLVTLNKVIQGWKGGLGN